MGKSALFKAQKFTLRCHGALSYSCDWYEARFMG